MPATNLLWFLLLFQADPASLGLAEFNRGEYQAARQHFEQAQSDSRARAFLPLTRAAMGECEAVTAQLDRQFKSQSDPALRRLTGLGLAQCLIGSKRFDAATPVLAELEREFSNDADVLYVSASLHMKAWNDAIHRMYEHAPGSYRVNEVSAEVFETQGKYAEAVAEYRKAIEKNPNGINLHYRLGRSLLLQSHDPAALQEARKEFQAELAVNPRDAVCYYQIGQIFAAEQDKAQATAEFERALQLEPDFPEALIAVGKARADAKKYEEAAKLFSRAAELQPRSETARYNLMLAYRNAGRTADAERIKKELERLQRPPEGEFTDFLKRLGEKAPPQ
jgi:tetratricopeptide (TPR) repeat protein